MATPGPPVRVNSRSWESGSDPLLECPLLAIRGSTAHSRGCHGPLFGAVPPPIDCLRAANARHPMVPNIRQTQPSGHPLRKDILLRCTSSPKTNARQLPAHRSHSQATSPRGCRGPTSSGSRGPTREYWLLIAELLRTRCPDEREFRPRESRSRSGPVVLRTPSPSALATSRKGSRRFRCESAHAVLR